MATITLVYDCNIGIQDPGTMAVRLAEANLDLYNNGTLDFLPFTVFSDVTVPDGLGVKRTIVLTVTADGEVQYPTDEEKKMATRQLFTQALALGGIVGVTAADPVVAP